MERRVCVPQAGDMCGDGHILSTNTRRDMNHSSIILLFLLIHDKHTSASRGGSCLQEDLKEPGEDVWSAHVKSLSLSE